MNLVDLADLGVSLVDNAEMNRYVDGIIANIFAGGSSDLRYELWRMGLFAASHMLATCQPHAGFTTSQLFRTSYYDRRWMIYQE
jgi:hypothetical protein